ncbi:MAG TPA: hypothetical protein VM307_13615 [Egibacteraceae bacterium]|nr:hypothetical protein [Egibacteraceae bacterium]
MRRTTTTLSAVLCAVLIAGAAASPALAGNGRDDARPARSAPASDTAKQQKAKEQKPKKKQPKEKQAAPRPTSAPAAQRSPRATKGPDTSAQPGSASSRPAAPGRPSSPGRSADAPHGKTSGSQAATGGNAGARQGQSARDGDHAPAGNKGSMKVRPLGTAPHPPRNYAHLPCVVQVDFYGSPHSGATLTARSHAPTSPTGETLLTETVDFASSSAIPAGNELVGTVTLDFTDVVSGLTYHAQQGYHVKLTAVQDGPQGADVKHKVFWIDCPPAEAGVTEGTAGESEGTQGDDVSTAPTGDRAEVGTGDDDAAVASVKGIAATRVLADGSPRAVTTARTIGAADDTVGVAGQDRSLAATGLGTLSLLLAALAAVGAGTEMVRRTRRR